MVLFYTKNKNVHVFEDRKNKILTARASMEDFFFKGTVEIDVKISGMEILSVKGKIDRALFYENCNNLLEKLDSIIGVRIGGGLTKKIMKLVGGISGCNYLSSLVMECCEGCILALTVKPLERAVPEIKRMKNLSQKMLADFMPNMKNSCYAFKVD
ncbi:MAG: DUF2889 domain-containing protein [Candidatus Helarchaeota archaeon]